MTTEFQTTPESLANLRDTVLTRYPDSQATLYLSQRGGKVVTSHGIVSEMLDQLVDYTIQFPRGLLRQKLDQPYGVIIMLWCHCTLDTGCEIKCSCDADRPRAVLVIMVDKLGNKLTPHRQREISAQALQDMKLPSLQ